MKLRKMRFPNMSLLLLLLPFLVGSSVIRHADAQPLSNSPPPSSDPISQSEEEKLEAYNAIVQEQALQEAQSIPENVQVRLNVSASLGANVTAVKLSTSELVQSGYTFLQFTLPAGLSIPTTSLQVLLLYRSISRTASIYVLNTSTTLVADVIGLQVFSYSPNLNFSAPALNVSAAPSPSDPILVDFSGTVVTSNVSLQQSVCTAFDEVPVYGSLSTVLLNTTAVQCQTRTLGDFSLTETITSPPPIPTLPPPFPPPLLPPLFPPSPTPSTGISASPPSSPIVLAPPPPRDGSSNTVAIAVGVVGGAIFLLLLCGLAIIPLMRYRKRTQLATMELVAERSVGLETASVGGGRAPAAGAERTRALLEGEEV